jgi:hypothetical protein
MIVVAVGPPPFSTAPLLNRWANCCNPVVGAGRAIPLFARSCHGCTRVSALKVLLKLFE